MTGASNPSGESTTRKRVGTEFEEVYALDAAGREGHRQDERNGIR